MSDGILKEVLQLEQQIEAGLCREQNLADAWLANTCRAIDLELRSAQEENLLATEQQNAETIRCARQNAAKKIYRERSRARTVAGLPDCKLVPLLEDHLKTVLTGREDDCPDDQS